MFAHGDNIPQKQKKGNQANARFPFSYGLSRTKCRLEAGFSRAKRREFKPVRLRAQRVSLIIISLQLAS